MHAARAGHDQVKQWVLQRNPDVSDIEPDCDLLESRLVDSLSFTEFVVFVARVSGVDICFDSLNVDDFRTLRDITERFFRVAAP